MPEFRTHDNLEHKQEPGMSLECTRKFVSDDLGARANNALKLTFASSFASGPPKNGFAFWPLGILDSTTAKYFCLRLPPLLYARLTPLLSLSIGIGERLYFYSGNHYGRPHWKVTRPSSEEPTGRWRLGSRIRYFKARGKVAPSALLVDTG